MRCKHCFFWKELNQQNNIPLDKIETISKSMDNLLFLRLTGGEPFLRNDVPEIVDLFYKNSGLRNLGINTNGFFTEKIINNVKEILSKNKIKIDVCVSIDDLPENHDKNRGVPNAFNKAVETITKLNELKKEFPNLTTTIGLTVTGENQNDLTKIFEILKDIRPDFISGNLIRGSPKNPELKDVDINNYLNFIKLIEGYNHSKHHNFYFNASAKDKMLSKTIENTLKEKKYQGIKCVAGDKMAVIYSNGEVYPCEMLSDKIGDLKDFDFDFKKLWNSIKRKEIRNKIINENCFCTHECFLSSSILLNPRGLAKSTKYLLK